MKRRWLIVLSCLALFALCAVRVYAVNHSALLTKYQTGAEVYEAGTNVELSGAMYYIDYADLTGYHMSVTGAELVKTADFLAGYGMTVEDLAALSAPGDSTDYSRYGYVYLVTAAFENDNWAGEQAYSVLLDNFLLVGLDYYIFPSGTINQIPDFNKDLDGASAFSIASGRTLEITLPYLIDTESERALSPEYLLQSQSKLLLTFYPTESYLKLPEPILR